MKRQAFVLQLPTNTQTVTAADAAFTFDVKAPGMANSDLIPPSAYEFLPSDPAERFLSLVAIAEANLSKRNSGDSVRKRFMVEVGEAANELKIGKLPDIPNGILTDPEWDNFVARLGGLKTRLRLRSQSAALPDSVKLNRVTKARIAQEVDRLRRLVDEGDISGRIKETLRRKLDEFIEELNRERLSFAKLAAVAAAIAGVFGGTSVGLANAPEAIATIGTILHWVGEAKAAEDEEQSLLPPPSRALPAPSDNREARTNNLDDIA